MVLAPVAGLGILSNRVTASEDGAGRVINTAADLPRTTFQLEALPSELVFDNEAAFETLKDSLVSDIEGILSEYAIEDAPTERQLRSTLAAVALLEARWDDLLAISATIRKLEDKPAARATSGFFANSYAEAAKAAGGDSGEAFLEAFRAQLIERITAMDFAIVQDRLEEMKGTFEVLTPAVLQGSIKGAMDQNAEAQDMNVGRDMAGGIIGARQTLRLLPLKDIVVEVLGARIAAETTEKTDLWTSRLVDLSNESNLATVRVGVWDSGTDPEVFGDRMWTNPDEVADGTDTDGNGFVDDLHGIAFDTKWRRSTGSLRPMPEEDLAQLGDLLELVKGSFDLKASVESPEASAYRQKVTSLSQEEVVPFILQLGRIGLYLHGTSTAYTTVENNPAAKVIHSRFDGKVDVVPDPMDETIAESFTGHVRDSVDYFKTHGAKVVNMSWRITMPQIESTLASIEPDPEKRRDRAAAIFQTMNDACVDAFNSAPGILFVAGAGNEDEDVEFVRSFPAGINLPNLITVGAVDIALEPASFTSFGSSIDLYANGFEVPTVVSGGLKLNLSGTSLAAPYVTNIAAKLWAVNPDLTVAEVRAMITETATTAGEKALPVIHPAEAMKRLK